MYTSRSSHRRCFIKKAVPKNFATFTEKHLCWNLFVIKLQTFRPYDILKNTCFEKYFQTAAFVPHLFIISLTEMTWSSCSPYLYPIDTFSFWTKTPWEQQSYSLKNVKKSFNTQHKGCYQQLLSSQWPRIQHLRK